VGTIFLLWNACFTCFFLTSSLAKAAGHSIEDAMALYGTYTMSVYFLRNWRILGGLGYRWAVVLGAGNDFGPRIDGS
jgi:hypothetical protein